VPERLRKARTLLDRERVLTQKLADVQHLLDEERQAYARENSLFGLSRSAFANLVNMGRTMSQRAA